MVDIGYYRAQAQRARLLAVSVEGNLLAVRLLLDMAKDYDDNVADLEAGATEIRHPELMPRNRGVGGEASVLVWRSRAGQ